MGRRVVTTTYFTSDVFMNIIFIFEYFFEVLRCEARDFFFDDLWLKEKNHLYLQRK